MAVKSDPGGFPQRRLRDIASVTPDQMREIQRSALEDFGYDIFQLVESAGRSVAELALAMLGGHARGQRVVVLAGGGNTGASGLAAARLLDNWGVETEPVLGAVEEEMSFSVRKQLHILRESGIVEPHDHESSEHSIEDHIRTADLVIDALVGYGYEGAPTGLIAAIAEIVNASRRPVLALDIPTGVSASTGEVHHPAIHAATTLIFGLPKEGQLSQRCERCLGDLYLADLGIPRAARERVGVTNAGLFSDGPIVRVRR